MKLEPTPSTAAQRARPIRSRRPVRSAALACAGVLALCSPVLAITPQAEFLNLLKKIAPFPPAAAKRLCRCTAVGTDAVGELRPAAAVTG